MNGKFPLPRHIAIAIQQAKLTVGHATRSQDGSYTYWFETLGCSERQHSGPLSANAAMWQRNLQIMRTAVAIAGGPFAFRECHWDLPRRLRQAFYQIQREHEGKRARPSPSAKEKREATKAKAKEKQLEKWKAGLSPARAAEIRLNAAGLTVPPDFPVARDEARRRIKARFPHISESSLEILAAWCAGCH